MQSLVTAVREASQSAVQSATLTAVTTPLHELHWQDLRHRTAAPLLRRGHGSAPYGAGQRAPHGAGEAAGTGRTPSTAKLGQFHRQLLFDTGPCLLLIGCGDEVGGERGGRVAFDDWWSAAGALGGV